ncbi:MAG: HAD family hydrolase [Actinomycetes bacterium]
MSGIRGMTVDLDDTLFPQTQWLAGAWAAVGDRATSLGLDGVALHRVLGRIAAEGSDRGGIIDRGLVAVGVRPEPYVAALVSAFCSYAPEQLIAYPGALAALGRLRGVVPVVLVTDGNPRIQRAKIKALGLEDLLDGVVVSDELGGRQMRKPNAAPFRQALGILGCAPDQAVHVGDRPSKDVAGAHGVGMRCVRVHTGEYVDLPDPDDLVPWRSADTFADAADLLLPLLDPSGVASPTAR